MMASRTSRSSSREAHSRDTAAEPAPAPKQTPKPRTAPPVNFTIGRPADPPPEGDTKDGDG